MKTQLESLYQKNLKQIKDVRLKFQDYDLEGPFLISPSDKYISSKKKIFIIGQQTKGWSCEIDDLQKQMKAYEEFNLGYAYYSSPFWNVFHKIEKQILGEEYCSAWGNFNKYDFEADRPFGEIENEISNLDFLLLEEIKILKPDICLFLIGYSFDERIKKLFKGAIFKQVADWNIKQLAKIEHSNLPVHSYRTYHPKYLRVSGLEEKFLNELKNEIK